MSRGEQAPRSDVDDDSDDELIAEEGMVEVETDDRDPLDPDDEEGDEGAGDDAMGGAGASPEGSEAGAPPADDAVHVFRGHTDSVYSVACSPAPCTRVASGGGDDVAFLWAVGEARDPLPLRAHADSVATLAFSADGALLASGGLDGVVCVWDAATGALRHKLEGPAEGIEWCAWHPRGAVVLAGSEDFSVWMWNAASAACMAVFTGHSGAVTCGAFTPDGKTVVTGSADASVRLWEPKTGAATATFSGHAFHSDAVTALDLRADGVGVSASTDKTAAIFSTHSNKVAGKLVGHEDSVECVGLHSSLPIVASGSSDGKLLLWDLNTQQARAACPHQEGVVQLAWHPTSPELVVSGCADGSVHVWDGRAGAPVRTFLGHREAVLAMALARDGQFVLTGSDDHACRVFALYGEGVRLLA